jgi:signal transduction histidine kinase
MENEDRNREKILEELQRCRRLLTEEIRAREQERKRIAAELHDGIGQSLTAIKVRVELALKEMGSDNLSGCACSLSSVVATIQGAIEEVRRISADLRPLILDELGILATISWLCRETQTLHRGLRIEKDIRIEENKVPETLKTVIYRVSQEALKNAAVHSRADLVRFSLRGMKNRIELLIDDNGCGFDLPVPPGKGFGLAGMKERTELSGGSFSVQSRPGYGTAVRALWES